MQSSRKQPSRRLEKRENSRRWLLIPALCAAVILTVVLIVELNKQPQVLPDNSNTTPVSHDQPTTPDPEPEPDPEPIPELLTLVNPWNQVPEDFQQTLYDNKVSEWMEQGYSREEAREKAGHQVAVPGTSEHQLGLAVDIVDVNYQLLDTNQENTAVQKWLLKNSWRYGFILRYPTDQTDVTGIVYEPWHYRYVGKEYAQDIYKKGLCLEQYLEQWGK